MIKDPAPRAPTLQRRKKTKMRKRKRRKNVLVPAPHQRRKPENGGHDRGRRNVDPDRRRNAHE